MKMEDLSLATVTDNPDHDHSLNGTKKKRKMKDFLDPLSSYEGCEEGKIFKLLQIREEMLKTEHKRKGSSVVNEDGKGFHLIHLLLITATSVEENKFISALQNLTKLYQNVSLIGDSVQRVVAYFADGLFARILTKKSPFFDMIIEEPTNEEQFLAFTDLYRVSPYYQFAHFTANQAILEAFENDQEQSNNRALQVIDFDVSYGFQWPSLIQSLSEKATISNKISLKITGYGKTIEELQETESRLVSFAKGFRNLVFEFQGLIRGSKIFTLMKKKKNETIAVNLIFHLNNLNDSLKISETLKSVHSLNPSIVFLVEQESSRNRDSTSFLSRFMESLHYFAAMFDSLDDCLPLESSERLRIEKNHLGKEIKNMLNFDKDDLNIHKNNNNSCSRFEKMKTWKGRMESHGFSGMKLSSKCLIQAKLILKIRSHYCTALHFDGESSSNGFRVIEGDDGKFISLGWKDRCLLTASAWRCV